MTEVNFVSKVLKSIAITFRLIDKTIQPYYQGLIMYTLRRSCYYRRRI